MGSAAIMRAVAVEGVRPDAAILESPFDRLLATVRNRFQAMGLPPFPGVELLVFWGSVQHGFNGFSHNPVEYAPAMTCRTLLMHGARDPRVTVEQNAAIYRQLGGQKGLVEFPSAEHELLINSAPQSWRSHVAEFLGADDRRPTEYTDQHKALTTRVLC